MKKIILLSACLSIFSLPVFAGLISNSTGLPFGCGTLAIADCKALCDKEFGGCTEVNGVVYRPKNPTKAATKASKAPH